MSSLTNFTLHSSCTRHTAHRLKSHVFHTTCQSTFRITNGHSTLSCLQTHILPPHTHPVSTPHLTIPAVDTPHLTSPAADTPHLTSPAVCTNSLLPINLTCLPFSNKLPVSGNTSAASFAWPSLFLHNSIHAQLRFDN